LTIFFGIALLLALGVIGVWQWWIIIEAHGKRRKELFLGWRALPVALVQLVLVGLAIKVLNPVFPMLSPIGYIIILVFMTFGPFLINALWYFMTTKFFFATKPLTGGPIKAYLYIFLQLVLMGMLLWLIWIIGQVVYKVSFG
jgi:hypothetical protein